jgi:hypothetical protein
MPTNLSTSTHARRRRRRPQRFPRRCCRLRDMLHMHMHMISWIRDQRSARSTSIGRRFVRNFVRALLNRCCQPAKTAATWLFIFFYAYPGPGVVARLASCVLHPAPARGARARGARRVRAPHAPCVAWLAHLPLSCLLPLRAAAGPRAARAAPSCPLPGGRAERAHGAWRRRPPVILQPTRNRRRQHRSLAYRLRTLFASRNHMHN